MRAATIPSRVDVGNDVIDGGKGNDTLNGGFFDDTISGGAGVDTMDGGDGEGDILDYSLLVGENLTVTLGAPNAQTTVGSSKTQMAGGEAAGDLIKNFEFVLGGAGNDTINGNIEANKFEGNDGNDTLNGGIGDDKLLGGGGDDVVKGGAGADQMDGGESLDEVLRRHAELRGFGRGDRQSAHRPDARRRRRWRYHRRLREPDRFEQQRPADRRR